MTQFFYITAVDEKDAEDTESRRSPKLSSTANL
jgi:hypothetical protein